MIEREECWALRRARAYGVEGPDEAPLCGHLEAAPAHGYICVPMMAQGEAFGLLHVLLGPDQDYAGPNVLDSKRRLALTVSEQLSLALANLSLRESLRHQSVSDPLTGLFNRRHMEDRLSREIARAGAGRPAGGDRGRRRRPLQGRERQARARRRRRGAPGRRPHARGERPGGGRRLPSRRRRVRRGPAGLAAGGGPPTGRGRCGRRSGTERRTRPFRR